MMPDFEKQNGNDEVWDMILNTGHPLLIKKQRRFGILPSPPRCKLCLAPFNGIGGWFLRRLDIKVSNRNPRFCNACDTFLRTYPGGTNVTLSMMFVDIRNSVPLSEKLGPKAFHDVVAGLRDAALRAMAKTDGSVLEYHGDAVIGVWPPGIAGENHAAKAIAAAEELVAHHPKSISSDDEVPIGISVHTDMVYMGTIASTTCDLQEISAFGYGVNLAARLADKAEAGKALVSESALQAAHRAMDEQHRCTLTLKGIDQPVNALALG